MGRIKDFISSLGEKQKEKKSILKQMEQQARFEKIVEDRQKSANLRELERYEKEDFEKQIKSQLEVARKKREHEINYGGNPLNAKNVTGKTEWEVLKNRNLFSGNKSNILNQKNIFKNNKRCY